MIRHKWFVMSISVLIALFHNGARSAENPEIEMINIERASTCSFLFNGVCEKTCRTGSKFIQVPDRSFKCVKMKND